MLPCIIVPPSEKYNHDMRRELTTLLDDWNGRIEELVR
jgi:hypothetical protein